MPIFTPSHPKPSAYSTAILVRFLYNSFLSGLKEILFILVSGSATGVFIIICCKLFTSNLCIILSKEMSYGCWISTPLKPTSAAIS